MAPAFHPPPEREKARYETHNNDVNDQGYREFVSPVVKEVTNNFGRNSKGLDFGAGTGPVAATILREQGFEIELYDPFFCNNPEVLIKKYDYIICSEVIEHFHDPAIEFRLIRSLLNQGGSLICMTMLYTDDFDFISWRYKDDETHVIFFHPESIELIKQEYYFSSVKINGRIIHFKTG